ncbi:unnamed protein product [Arctia plantaginis]|uniref:Arrestin C-terminal-like domain-containing protein n=1 Tax=Arctia plantaginis TaxID=874455 RepID=A0A8S1A2T6_ARCPL|nr:unnamed protein product [Arctia plantaginis]
MGLGYQIILTQNKDGIFRSGETVYGVLRCVINKPKKYQFINVSLKGIGKCSWTESCVLSKSNHSTFYHGKEKYVSLHKTLLPKIENSMLAGVHDLPFQFQLPPDLPSSFKDKICKIKYKVVAEISNAGFFGCTKKVEAEIQVRGILKRCSTEPLVFGLTKSPFTIKKTVDLKIEIEKTFLEPGEKIKLKCVVSNATNLPIICLKIMLITQTTYTSDDKHKHVQRQVIDRSVGESREIQGNCITELYCSVATLENLYSIQHSRILMREYKLNVALKFPFPHRDATVEIPVVIGESNVPGLMYSNISYNVY